MDSFTYYNPLFIQILLLQQNPLIPYPKTTVPFLTYENKINDGKKTVIFFVPGKYALLLI
jgi:hypothetical protein